MQMKCLSKSCLLTSAVLSYDMTKIPAVAKRKMLKLSGDVKGYSRQSSEFGHPWFNW